MSELIYFNRNKYWKALHDSQKTRFLDYFVAFFIELDRKSFVITRILELIESNSLRKINDSKINDSKINFIKLLLFLDIDEKWISYKDISPFLDTTKQNAFLHLNNLCKEGILQRKSVKNTHIYKMEIDKFIFK